MHYGDISVISALELTSKNILCGSVRMVWAIIYTLFLVCTLGMTSNPHNAHNYLQGFSLTIGSDLYLVVNKHARTNMALATLAESQTAHGVLLNNNDTTPFGPLSGIFEIVNMGIGGNVYKGPSQPTPPLLSSLTSCT